MFEIEDEIKIKDNFWLERYGTDSEGGKDPGVVENMKQYAGRTFIVDNTANDHTTRRYSLRGIPYWWDERWFEPIKEIHIDENSIMGVFQDV